MWIAKTNGAEKVKPFVTLEGNKNMPIRLRKSAAVAFCLIACAANIGRAFAQGGRDSRADQKKATQSAQWPMQLQLRVPFEPTAFPSGGHFYLLYELHLANYGPFPLSLHRIEVLDGDVPTAQPIASFEAESLQSVLQPLVGQQISDRTQRLVLQDGQCAIAYMSIAFERGSPIPTRLVHQVSTADSAVEGAPIGTHHTRLQVLGPPLEGSNWLADDGPSNDEDNHHRRGVVILDGTAVNSRRYAIDWKKTLNGASFSGNDKDVHSYYSYGQSVLAVGNGRVVAARDHLPENVPGHGASFHPAVPITLETVAGNTITLDLGEGEFAYYLHLLPGSVRVKPGDRVRRGQVLAQVGASGDAREPHLHFEVTTSPKLLAGEGVPYLIDRYSCQSASDGDMGLRTHELPLDHSLIKFGAGGDK
jgi:hypothetical protein